ncbi:MAG: N-sulfoglucosamine sulfohydrolase [Solirubrobacteraceae bacterium]|nr:N-sulfoglucosamine sulfohydrolase [Solirubrobacteraceae bacterium]
MTHPNILYLHSHDTGRYAQPYGFQVPTPNIQALADQGVLFRQAFCAAPTCSASRACLLTGQYGHANGMLGLAHRGWSLNDYSHHIVHTLRRIGYTSTLIGEQHISKEPDVIGYDEVMKIPTTKVESVAPLAIEVLKRDQDRPFFLSVGFFETHREFLGPGSIRDAHFSQGPANLPDHPDVRQDIAGFKASARSLDHGVGMVLNQLETSGLDENTIVIFTTDHGMPFPGAKATLYDRGLGVMLMLRGPRPFSGGRVNDQLVSHLDLFPTVCDFLEVERPGWLQGVSLLPMLRGEARSVRDEIHAGSTWHAAYEPQRCIRTTRHKYIRRWGDRRTPVLPNTDDGPSKDLLLANGWADREIPAEQLYDLLFDPNEANNVIDDPAYASVAVDLRARLLEWQRDTGDPLAVADHVDPPHGVDINTPDQRSASEPTTHID